MILPAPFFSTLPLPEISFQKTLLLPRSKIKLPWLTTFTVIQPFPPPSPNATEPCEMTRSPPKVFSSVSTRAPAPVLVRPPDPLTTPVSFREVPVTSAVLLLFRVTAPAKRLAPSLFAIVPPFTVSPSAVVYCTLRKSTRPEAPTVVPAAVVPNAWLAAKVKVPALTVVAPV